MRVVGFERWWLEAWPHRLHIRRFVPRFLRSCPEPFRGEVLEVGAGSGWTSRRMLDTFPQIELTATDVEAASAGRFAKLRVFYGQRLRFQRADLLDLPFDRGSFDVVVALHVLHRIDDVPRAVRQFVRVLRSGGLLGVVDDSPPRLWPLTRLFPAASRLRRAALEALLREEGCEIMVAHGQRHYYVWARKPHPV